MKNYEEFKISVLEQIKDYVSNTNTNVEPYIYPCTKINVIKDGLILKPVENSGNSVSASPVVYLNDYYATYVKTGDERYVITEMAKALETPIPDSITSLPSFDKKFVLENVILRLVNKARNSELLSKHPHRDFLDLSVTYFVVIQDHEDYRMGASVSNELAQNLGLTENELFERAYANTRSKYPFVCKSIYEVLGDLLPEPKKDDLNMLILSNEKNDKGSSVLLYDTELAKVSDRLNSDLYILPSSVEEVIAIPAKHNNTKMLGQMVRSINGTEVKPDDVLSDSVYYYNRETHSLTIAEKGSDEL